MAASPSSSSSTSSALSNLISASRNSSSEDWPTPLDTFDPSRRPSWQGPVAGTAAAGGAAFSTLSLHRPTSLFVGSSSSSSRRKRCDHIIIDTTPCKQSLFEPSFSFAPLSPGAHTAGTEEGGAAISTSPARPTTRRQLGPAIVLDSYQQQQQEQRARERGRSSSSSEEDDNHDDSDRPRTATVARAKPPAPCFESSSFAWQQQQEQPAHFGEGGAFSSPTTPAAAFDSQEYSPFSYTSLPGSPTDLYSPSSLANTDDSPGIATPTGSIRGGERMPVFDAAFARNKAANAVDLDSTAAIFSPSSPVETGFAARGSTSGFGSARRYNFHLNFDSQPSAFASPNNHNAQHNLARSGWSGKSPRSPMRSTRGAAAAAAAVGSGTPAIRYTSLTPPSPDELVMESEPISPISPNGPSGLPYLAPHHLGGMLSSSPTGTSKAERRRSVDVAALSARGLMEDSRSQSTQVSGTAIETSAVSPKEQLRSPKHHRNHIQPKRESLFAQHLTSILAHSLSLCAAGGVDTRSGDASEDGTECACGEHDGNSSTAPSSSESSPRSSISHRDDAHDADSPRAGSFSSPGPSRLRRQRLPSLPSITPSRRLELMQFLDTWSFDANELDQDELCECACIVFECALQLDGLDGVLEMNRMRALLISLRSAYHSRNAYHNFAHAVDVLQACYSFLTTLGLAPPLATLTNPSFRGRWTRGAHLSEAGSIGDLMRPIDVLALLVAAIGHDVGHPGLSNAYMVNARTPAAQVYNDKSVLENFHSVTLARMLKLHGLGHLLESDNGNTDFRQVLLASVLATDMSRHFPFVGKLTDLGTRLSNNGYRSTNVREDRLLLCSGFMKCADISNPTRPHEIAKQWSTALLEEWAVQAEIEAKFKLPISVVILNPEERLAQAKSQVGFVNLFTQPLFDAMTGVVPQFKTFADRCRDGKVIWEAIVASGEGDSLPSAPGRQTVSPMSTPRASSSAAFASTPSKLAFQGCRNSSGTCDGECSTLPPSRGFSSRLPPHRAPRSLKSIDASRANALADAAVLSPATGSSGFTASPSPRAASLFDRSASISSTTTSASSIFPSSVDECLPLGDEECTGNCKFITATCASCARKASTSSQQAQTPLQEESEVVTYFGSPAESGVWPPDPFRPRPAVREQLVAA